MKTKSILLLAGALFSTSALVKAEHRPFGNGQLPEFLKQFDTDGDGKLSAEERQAAAEAIKEERKNHADRKNPWDTNGDGVLSDEEKAAAQAAIKAKIEEKRLERFTELDEDEDGFLTAEEFKPPHPVAADMLAKIFDRLDKDGDDKISKEEFLAGLRPIGGGGAGGGGHNPPPPPPPPPLPEWLKPYDTDGDGKLSAEEQAKVRADIESGVLVPPRR